MRAQQRFGCGPLHFCNGSFIELGTEEVVVGRVAHVQLDARIEAGKIDQIEAAQTGHFVLSTLHTRGAIKTIDRIMEFFPKEQQPAILARLSETLTFVLSQGLLTGFNGRVLVTEYLQNTSDAVAAGIRAYDGAATSLEDALRVKGNLRWNNSLKDLYRAGMVPEEVFNANLLS